MGCGIIIGSIVGSHDDIGHQYGVWARSLASFMIISIIMYHLGGLDGSQKVNREYINSHTAVVRISFTDDLTSMYILLYAAIRLIFFTRIWQMGSTYFMDHVRQS